MNLNKVPEASITTGGRVLASLRSVQFAKDAKEELRQMLTKYPAIKLTLRLRQQHSCITGVVVARGAGA